MTSNYFKKIDDFLLGLTTSVVIHWIKKKKYEQHKYDFALMVKGWEAAWWLGVIIFRSYGFFLHHKIGAGVVELVFMVFIGIVESMAYFFIKSVKERHDVIFANRKNPIIYEMEKQVLESVKESTQKARFFSICMLALLSLTILFLDPLILPIYMCGLSQTYITLVFDFDEPPKKKKEVKDSITEIMRKSWQALTGQLNPKGV